MEAETTVGSQKFNHCLDFDLFSEIAGQTQGIWDACRDSREFKLYQYILMIMLSPVWTLDKETKVAAGDGGKKVWCYPVSCYWPGPFSQHTFWHVTAGEARVWIMALTMLELHWAASFVWSWWCGTGRCYQNRAIVHIIRYFCAFLLRWVRQYLPWGRPDCAWFQTEL